MRRKHSPSPDKSEVTCSNMDAGSGASEPYVRARRKDSLGQYNKKRMQSYLKAHENSLGGKHNPPPQQLVPPAAPKEQISASWRREGREADGRKEHRPTGCSATEGLGRHFLSQIQFTKHAGVGLLATSDHTCHDHLPFPETTHIFASRLTMSKATPEVPTISQNAK